MGLRRNNHDLNSSKQDNLSLSFPCVQISWCQSRLLPVTKGRLFSSSHIKYLELAYLRTPIFSTCLAEFCRRSLANLWATFSTTFYWPYMAVAKILHLESSKTTNVCHDTFRTISEYNSTR